MIIKNIKQLIGKSMSFSYYYDNYAEPIISNLPITSEINLNKVVFVKFGKCIYPMIGTLTKDSCEGCDHWVELDSIGNKYYKNCPNYDFIKNVIDNMCLGLNINLNYNFGREIEIHYDLKTIDNEKIGQVISDSIYDFIE